jgi:hypothetical protein
MVTQIELLESTYKRELGMVIEKALGMAIKIKRTYWLLILF